MSLAPRPKDDRRVAREEVCFRCEISGPDLAPLTALIVNISPLGCMMRCKTDVAQGTLLRVILPMVGACKGRVIWSMAARMGIEFDKPIAADPYLAMLGEMSRRSDDMGIY